MRRTDSDLLRVAEPELDRLSEDELLRLVVITRDDNRKSAITTLVAWGKLVERDIDRVRGIAAAFRHPQNPGVRVHPANVDDVTQDSYIRLLRMAFRGTSIGEYRAAMRTCVKRQCMDHCRREMADDMHRRGSLDETVQSREGDERPKYEREIAEQERRRMAEEEEIEAEIERLAEQHQTVDDAVARIEDERKRRVLEMTFDRCSTAQIAEALETSEDNVYQLRRRALLLLDDIINGKEGNSDGDGSD